MMNNNHDYDLVTIDIDLLRIDHKYQRDFDREHSLFLAKNWKWDSCLPLVGSLRIDGFTYLVDGQHRYNALKINEFQGDIKVLQYEGLSLTEEAQLFLDYHKTKTVRAIDKYRSSLIALNHETLVIEAILQELKLKVSKTTGPRTIQAVTALYTALKRGGPDNLQKTLIAIERAWGDDGMYRADIIEGLTLVYSIAMQNLDNEVLIRTLRKFPLVANPSVDRNGKPIDSWTVRARAQVGPKGALGQGMKQAIVASYNTGRSASKRI